MRKKYQNTASLPIMKQFYPGFQDISSNQNEMENSKVTPSRYTINEQDPASNRQLKMQKNNQRLLLNGQNLEKNKKIGTEIDRMEDYMTDIYNKRRNQKPFKKNANSNLDISNVSIVNAAQLRLPTITSPPSYSNSNDQSKLVEEIRRVQNKIKQLRFQRNLASSQQQKYQMMRPFIELQNQNMMNMQYMMMMAQQNKGNDHHCCSHANFTPPTNQTRIMYVPYPPYGPLNPTMTPQYCNNPQQTPMKEYSNHSPPPQNYEHPSPKTTNKFKTQKKVYNFKKIRKFRIGVIAVCFYLLFPKFVNRFTKKRFQLHSQKYFNTPEPHHSTIITKAFDILSDINFYELAKTVQEHRKQKEIRRVAKSKTAKLVISEQYGQVKNYEIYLGDLQVFLLVLLKKLHEIIQTGTFDDLINEISVGNLPYSFPIDHSYIQEEMYRLKFHPQKTYIQCNELQSKALLMITFFVKLLAYDFLFVIRQDIDWKNHLLKRNNLKKNQMIEAEMVATQMYISGILLHRYCMDILEGEIKEIQGNVDKIDQKVVPLPMGMMVYESKDEVNHEQKLKKSGQKGAKGAKGQKGQKGKRKSKQSQVQEQDQESQEFHLFQFQYIKKLAEFEGLMAEIIQKSGHNEEVKQKISDIVDQIYKKSVQNRNLQYKQITQSVLNADKNFLTKRIGVEKNSFEMPKRSNEQKNQIKELVKQIKDDKKKENQRLDLPKKSSKQLTMKNIKYVGANKNAKAK